jgi:hypothetical protein
MLIAIHRQKRKTNDVDASLDSERAITDASDALPACCLYSKSDSPATLVYSRALILQIEIQRSFAPLDCFWAVCLLYIEIQC